MARLSGKVFIAKVGEIERIGRKFGNRTKDYDIIMEKRMTLATNLVWRIAHQKRPMITKAVAKKGRLTKMGNISYRRVSDPNAKLGVPVDTGLLQSVVKKVVRRLGYGKFQGEVFVDLGVAPYGRDMEYGTTKVHARPFMRPAKELTQDALHRLFRAKAQ